MVVKVERLWLDHAWKSQTKSMKLDFNNAHIVVESQNFYFYIKKYMIQDVESQFFENRDA